LFSIGLVVGAGPEVAFAHRELILGVLQHSFSI
jgi:hypothetical protein